jgi:hypothetical protein
MIKISISVFQRMFLLRHEKCQVSAELALLLMY